MPLRLHAVQLARCLNEAPCDSWGSVSEWLSLAGSVGSVQVDTTQNNPNFGYCSSADRFELAREELLREFVSGLTVFMFIWGALEAAIDVVKPPKAARPAESGKIADTCRYLARSFEFRVSIPELGAETAEFLRAAACCPGYEKIKLQPGTLKQVGLAGSGLQVVYKVRNLFAHGALSFPLPDDENRPLSGHSQMVAHGTRVVLLSVQMLALAHTDESDEPIRWEDEDGEPHELPLSSVLRSCHLYRDKDDMQRALL